MESEGGDTTLSEREASPRKRGRLRLILLLVGVLVLELMLRNERADALLDVTERSLEPMNDAVDKLVARMDRAEENDRVSDTEIRAVQALADDARVDFVLLLDDAERVTVLPWHGELRSARDAWVDLLQAWVAYFEGFEGELAAWPNDSDIGIVNELAERRFRAATDRLPLFHVRERAETMFEDDGE